MAKQRWLSSSTSRRFVVVGPFLVLSLVSFVFESFLLWQAGRLRQQQVQEHFHHHRQHHRPAPLFGSAAMDGNNSALYRRGTAPTATAATTNDSVAKVSAASVVDRPPLSPNNNTASSATASFFTADNDNNHWLLAPDDPLLSRNEWDMSPIVVPQYKLIFFTQAKVGCTVWKQLFRRMMGLNNWRVETAGLPWNPRTNGLTYLYHYDRVTASAMLRDDNWIKAIFVRDPIERFVSAWLDKAVRHPTFLSAHCCSEPPPPPPQQRPPQQQQREDDEALTNNNNNNNTLCAESKSSIAAFLRLVKICDNPHWRPQSRRLPHASYWQFINFVGRMEYVADHAESLLRQIGAWEEYGQSGWGNNGDDNNDDPDNDEHQHPTAIFRGETMVGRHHATSARQRWREYMTTELEYELRHEMYAADYDHPNITGGGDNQAVL